RHEPLLELELARGRPDPCAEPVVGGRQQTGLESYGARDPLGQRRQRLAAAHRLGADEMKSEIAVAELEPGLTAEPLDRVEGVPGLLRATPTALLVAQAGQRVEQR